MHEKYAKMDEVIGLCPSKKTKPLFPATLSRFWKEVVAEKEPNWQLNPLVAVTVLAVTLLKLAAPVNDGLAVGAFASRAACKPEVLAMLSDASGQVKAPVQVRGVLKVLPAAAMEKSVAREAFWKAKVLKRDWKVYA